MTMEKQNKYVITGIEKVRDVVEAPDSETAKKLFYARYPAIIKITDINVIKPKKSKEE